MTYKDKIKSIRGLMIREGIDVYVIPSSDPHINEYLPSHYEIIKWLSGFTGSVATIVITQDTAGVWTDGRYFVQAEEELKDSGFTLMKLKTQGMPEYIDWIVNKLNRGSIVGFDGNLVSMSLMTTMRTSFKQQDFKFRTNTDFISSLWTLDRPAILNNEAFFLKDDISGESTVSKIDRLKKELKNQKVDFHAISALDDIAWILNVRGSDVKCNPLVLSHMLVSQKSVTWFVNEKQINHDDIEQLKSIGVEIKPYNKFFAAISEIPSEKTILIDSNKVCQIVYESIPYGVKIKDGSNPSTELKAIKNEVEQAHIHQAMVYDGQALVQFLKWLEENITKDEHTEISVAQKLEGFRKTNKLYVGESFTTISAYKENGALPHYRPTPKNNKTLKPEGLFLIDSGAQYHIGTTDITRVVSLGNLTEQEKIDYTLVLKGMIDVTMASFPEGTKGYQLDSFARRWLWQSGADYAHGTGHGVGFFLNVHEGPQNIRSNPNPVAFKVGMLTSNEPGIYRVGHYGIRLENLILCKKDKKTEFGTFLGFETTTLCHFERNLIKVEMLSEEQRNWLNNYHKEVYNKLSTGLSEEDKLWLKAKTETI